jgi:hypothetical protein
MSRRAYRTRSGCVVGSANVSTVINSGRFRKKIPNVGQMVRVEGRAGLYKVVRVDRDRRVADVARGGKINDSELAVSFTCIVHVDAKISQSIRQFLKS